MNVGKGNEQSIVEERITPIVDHHENGTMIRNNLIKEMTKGVVKRLVIMQTDNNRK